MMFTNFYEMLASGHWPSFILMKSLIRAKGSVVWSRSILRKKCSYLFRNAETITILHICIYKSYLFIHNDHILFFINPLQNIHPPFSPSILLPDLQRFRQWPGIGSSTSRQAIHLVNFEVEYHFPELEEEDKMSNSQ